MNASDHIIEKAEKAAASFHLIAAFVDANTDRIESREHARKLAYATRAMNELIEALGWAEPER